MFPGQRGPVFLGGEGGSMWTLYVDVWHSSSVPAQQQVYTVCNLLLIFSHIATARLKDTWISPHPPLQRFMTLVVTTNCLCPVTGTICNNVFTIFHTIKVVSSWIPIALYFVCVKRRWHFQIRITKFSQSHWKQSSRRCSYCFHPGRIDKGGYRCKRADKELAMST